MTGRLVVNPEFARFAGSNDMGYLGSRPDYVFRLAPGALALIAYLASLYRRGAPRRKGRGPTARHLPLEHRVLLPEGESPRTGAVTRAHPLLGFAGAPR